MKQQLAIAAAFILIAVGAGPMTAAPVRAQPGPPCSGTNHCVDITIAGGAIQSVANVVVPGTNHQIYWQIKTGGYSFPPPPHSIGIAFKEPSPARFLQ